MVSLKLPLVVLVARTEHFPRGQENISLRLREASALSDEAAAAVSRRAICTRAGKPKARAQEEGQQMAVPSSAAFAAKDFDVLGRMTQLGKRIV